MANYDTHPTPAQENTDMIHMNLNKEDRDPLPRNHLVYQVPQLQAFVYKEKFISRGVTNFWWWAHAVWHAPQGTNVPILPGLLVEDANLLTSHIKEYKARWDRVATDRDAVHIKKVAEIRGSRFNNGKPRYDLIDAKAMEGLARVLTKGAVKYAAHNWRAGLPYTETIASMLRHIMAIQRGEDVDPETGEMHADHVQCNAMFLSNMMKTRPDMDDRWKPNAGSKIASGTAAQTPGPGPGDTPWDVQKQQVRDPRS